ncbi:MAG: glucose-1-phosphate thymidylyltransferase [Dehalococcoidia bacterium]|nr:glucose-1-phosphate thymidylyltransferase [Dehalococcoidia bacterium]
MKGVELVGGKGSRLRPFTYSGAKQLVPVANIPVLHFPVRQLVDAGITEIALVVGDTEPQIRSAMGDGSVFGARFTYIRQETPLGIAHGLGLCRDFAGAEPVVLYLGDNVLLGGISTFVERFAGSTAKGAVVLKEVEDPRAFGVAVVEHERLKRVVEKPTQPPSNLAVIGVYAFRPEVFEVIAALRPSARGELEIADAINGLINAGLGVEATVTSAYWIDTGKMEDMLSANRAILDTCADATDPAAHIIGGSKRGVAAIAFGARLEACELIGPVAIGAGAELRGCRIGPYVAIGSGSHIEGSAIRNSIVMEESSITACPGLEDSMIGRFTVVERAPAGARLTLGDHSRFEGPA